MSDELEPLQKTTTVTVDKPPDRDHFTEITYVMVIIGLLLFVAFMSHVHNDSLAGKGMDFTLIIIGALTQASTGGIKRQ